MNNTPPPSMEQIVAYVAGDLSLQAAAELEGRIAQDARARALLAEVRLLVAFLGEERAVQPPAALVERASRLLGRERPGLVESLRQGVLRVVASLDFDSRLPGAALGFRGVGEAVQVSFSSDRAEIDLEIEPAGEAAWTIRGQVDSELSGPVRVVLVQGDESEAASVALEEDGGFVLRASAGTYGIRVEASGVVIEAGPVHVP